ATDMVGCGVWVNDAVYCGEASFAFVDRAHPVVRVAADWFCPQEFHYSSSTSSWCRFVTCSLVMNDSLWLSRADSYSAQPAKHSAPATTTSASVIPKNKSLCCASFI